MLTIRIHNEGTTPDGIADYTFRVDVNGREIDRGVVSGHRRSDGWARLLALLVEQHEPSGIRHTVPCDSEEDGS